MKIHSSRLFIGLPRLLSTSFVRATSKARKAALLLFSVAVLLAGGAAAVRGQSALDGFDPNANDVIYAVVVQPDGKILIGGTFTTVLGVTRNNIARLNPDGTLDAAFNPNANARVLSIAVQADGKIFSRLALSHTIGGQATRNYIARLDATTGLADSFNPNADSTVFSIAVQADGKILAGGFFTRIGGQTRNSIARLDATTGLADSFNPNADGPVFSIAVQAGGKILVGGDFTTPSADRRAIASPGSMPRPAWLIRSTRTRTMLSCFQSRCRRTARFWRAAISTDIGGQTRNHIARLDATTGVG